MNIQKIKITELKPAKYNPRKDLKPEDEEYQKIKKKYNGVWICNTNSYK